MHAVIVALSDESYDKLVAICRAEMDHSWLAAHLLEEAIRDAPTPGRCKICHGPFFLKTSTAHQVYCSEPCRKKGYQQRKMRWWKTRGKQWRATRGKSP